MVVGIGASAGGLPALREFFREIPRDIPGAFVVVQHLSPDHDSLMAEVLGRYTPLTCRQAADGLQVEAGTLYLIPPATHLRIDQGVLYLDPPDVTSPPRPSHPIDHFFESMAESEGARSTCVILSGSGQDGTRGARLIFEAGGKVFAQSPAHAEFEGMPRSALLQGIVSDSGTAEALANMIVALMNRDAAAPAPEEPDAPVDPRVLEQVVTLLASPEGPDFRAYKPSTIARRLVRSARQRGAESVEAYVDLLEGSPEERQNLREEMLIHVTHFFRDAELWAHLSEHLIPELVRRASASGELRLWCAACSSGEEAYSLAMLVEEELERVSKELVVKIFATDVSERILQRAMEGVFTEGQLEGVSADRVARFFRRKGDVFVARPRIRQRLILTRHDLLNNPPFPRLHMLSCRNMLMYVKPEMQRKIINSFHGALEQRGILLLGQGESAGSGHLFHATHRHLGLHVRSPGAARFNDTQLWSSPVEPRATPAAPRAPSRALAREVEHPLFQAAMHAAQDHHLLVMILNPDREVVSVLGDTDRYLRHHQGDRSADVMQVVRQELGVPLAVALHQSEATGGRGEGRATLQGADPGHLDVQVSVRPSGEGSTSHLEVIFSTTPATVEGPTAAPSPSNHDLLTHLERELERTRAALKTSLLDLEAQSQEQQSTNEELRASNEELQATNEELHSLNEELHSVNAEYQCKINELTELNADIDNLMQSTLIGTVLLDRNLRIRRFTQSITGVINILPHDIGRPISHLTHTLEGTDLAPLLQDVLDTGQRVEADVQTRQGTCHLMRIHPYHSDRSGVDGMVLTFVDITPLKRVEMALREKETRLREVIDLVPHPLFAKDHHGRFVLVNHALAEVYALPPERLLGAVEAELLTDEAIRARLVEQDRQVIDSAKRIFVPDDIRCDAQGNVRTFQTTKIPLSEGEEGAALLGISVDVTEQRVAEEQLRYRALYDALTGLPNRTLFCERLRHCISRCQRRDGPGFSVLFMDLDSFKEVNDTLGHLAGDELLGEVAARLKECIRPGDTVARLGGDEFAMLLEGADRVGQAELVAARVHHSIGQAFTLQGKALTISTSVGVAICTDGATDVEAVMRQADVAMYASKREGPGLTRLFTHHMSEAIESVVRTRTELQRALVEQEFELHYQPIVDLKTRRLCGLEVLVRWRHPQRGLLAPDSFLPIAQGYGLQQRIDEWVIREACHQLQHWSRRFDLPEDLTLSVNVSGDHLQQGDLATYLMETATAAGVPHEKLVVELTESSIIHAPSVVATALQHLRDLHFGVALDDFGTGYSSLSHLRQLPLQILKVDRSFTRHLGQENTTTQIVKALVALGKALDIRVTAEGVEHPHQEAILLELGCHRGQGYLFSRPLDTHAMGDYLQVLSGIGFRATPNAPGIH